MTPLQGQIRAVLGDDSRHVLIYSGDMFNTLHGEDFVLTMDVMDHPTPLAIELPGQNRWVWYTWLEHTPKAMLGPVVHEISKFDVSEINTKLFLILTTN
ncbi:hypothetical protein GCM10012275_13560 [Longimycelium tulufanense]|uniref:Uncharacterized protein n=1 Tax=Longimycelium tulufanense TaxID=907463 RepID=A0A8J3CBN3_9PSEU|nr:hypothetical protein [Longimycelium tulufanense]GGM43814.1 hypothetical protein GCM10012275_13560 [Longimycelium tulufanense]